LRYHIFLTEITGAPISSTGADPGTKKVTIKGPEKTIYSIESRSSYELLECKFAFQRLIPLKKLCKKYSLAKSLVMEMIANNKILAFRAKGATKIYVFPLDVMTETGYIRNFHFIAGGLHNGFHLIYEILLNLATGILDDNDLRKFADSIHTLPKAIQRPEAESEVMEVLRKITKYGKKLVSVHMKGGDLTEKYKKTIEKLEIKLLHLSTRYAGYEFILKLENPAPKLEVDINQIEELLHADLIDFNIPPRVLNILFAKNIFTIGDLLRTPVAKLEKFQHLGPRSILYLQEFLDGKGLKLGQLEFENAGI
jgi:hypothetical protein